MRRLLPPTVALALPVVPAVALPSRADAAEASLAAASFCPGVCRYQDYEEGRRVVFRADPGERNAVKIENTDGRVTLRDAGAPVRAGAGCQPVDPSAVSCSLGGMSVLESSVSLGDGDDQLTVAGWLGGIADEGLGGLAEIDAGPGDDIVVGGRGSETVEGGPGRDVLQGGRGDDRFPAGDEDLGAPDRVDGGPGWDLVSYAQMTRRVRADLTDGKPVQGPPGKGDRFVAVEGVAGGSGNDVIVGGPGQDDLEGGPGADLLKGRGDGDYLSGGIGRDRLYGGPGKDVLDSRGGASDVLRCGGDSDRVGISVDLDLIDDLQPPDPTDVLAADCERVLVKGENDEPTWPELYVLASTDDALVFADPTLDCVCTGKLTLTFGKRRTLAGRSRLAGTRTVRVPLILARDRRIRPRHGEGQAWRRVHH